MFGSDQMGINGSKCKVTQLPLMHVRSITEIFCVSRNWGYHWGEGGAGTDSCSETYRGPEAFSEVEATNVRDFILKQNNMVKVTSLRRHINGHI
jgi:hypothetical protein